MLRRNFYLYLLLSFISCDLFANTQENKVSFLSFSDIHFNPYASCEDNKPCLVVKKLRETNAAGWSKIFVEYDKSEQKYNQDTNYHLLTVILNSIKKISDQNNVQVLFIPGDFLAHDYRGNYKKYSGDMSYKGYHEFVKKTFEFLTLEIQKRFPGLDVYPLVGNNDSYHSDYIVDPGGHFLKDAANFWAPLIKDKVNRANFQKTLPIGGYYTFDSEKLNGVKMIALNTVLFSTEARGKNITKAANEEFIWLHKQLILAKNKHQKVVVMMHIPMAIDIYLTSHMRLFTLMNLWKSEYIKRFQQEITEFSEQIIMILSAHLHMDWLQFLTFNNGIEIPVSTNSSISPIFGNNPGFKLYHYNVPEKHMENFVSYSWSLNQLFTLLNVEKKPLYICPRRNRFA